jgi:anti-anti-sigma regulatory factor
VLLSYIYPVVKTITLPQIYILTTKNQFIMDFKISNCNNFFKVKGILNKNNVSLFNDEFNNIFDRVNNLTISIQDIISMDKYGVDAILELHERALAKNKKLSIIGSGCKELYDHFKTETAA